MSGADTAALLLLKKKFVLDLVLAKNLGVEVICIASPLHHTSFISLVQSQATLPPFPRAVTSISLNEKSMACGAGESNGNGVRRVRDIEGCGVKDRACCFRIGGGYTDNVGNSGVKDSVGV